MIHPDTELRYINDQVGYGVVATKFIPKGTITWCMDKLDRIFESSDLITLGKEYEPIIDKYCYRDGKGRYVLCWDISRYINHSFNSNCITTAYEFELAVRDIQPGEELTDDYGYLNLTEPWECLPEKGSKRTKVMPDDLIHFHPEWDKKLVDAFASYNNLTQPLEPFLAPDVLAKVRAITEGKQQMDSILNCYCGR